MADNVYQIGEPVPVSATFKDANGALTDPTTVTLEVRSPAGIVTTPTATHASTGVYTANLTAAEPGVWWYAFIGTGAVAATEQDTFVVQARETQTSTLSTNALVSLADAREYVLRDVTDNTQDLKLIHRINAFSAEVRKYTQREWLPVTTAATRRFRYPGYGMLALAPYDLRAATVPSIVVFADYPASSQYTLQLGDATNLPEYELLPVGGDPFTGTYRWVRLGPYRGLTSAFAWGEWSDHSRGWPNRVPFDVTVTGDWGIGVIPDDVKLAVLIAVDNSFENPEGAASRTMGPLSYSEPSEALGPGTSWRALPAESRALLADYVDRAPAVA